ncbi:MAG: PQQ-binding-like beta-propeller repeat protein [Deltaproteobacteria bacterium]|nr:PQQ-binding-like beta-propeller repeat protein [Deltaproteobacteria bacterium]
MIRSLRTTSFLLPFLFVVPFAHAGPGVLLYGTEGNRLRRYDLDTVDGPSLIEDVLIDRASASEEGGAAPSGNFRDSNGIICLFRDGSGRFVLGEDSGQPNPPAGFGVFEKDGSQIGKLTPTYNNQTSNPEPFGCAFDDVGRLFTSDVGDQGFTTPTGQLTVWFPPFDVFPGPPGAYPNTNDSSTNFCKLATDIGTAAEVVVDSQGRIYMASASGLQILRFNPPFPTGPDAARGCGAIDPQGSPRATLVDRETFATGFVFTGLALSPRGTLYASSVLTGDILEYDLDGNLLRTLVDPPEALPPISTGNPQSLAVGPDGTIYYADLDLVGTFPDLGPGPNGKVRRVRFDGAGDPLPPEVIRQNLSFPDGVAVLPGDLEPLEWRTYFGDPERHGFNPAEVQVRSDNVSGLQLKWEAPSGAIITGSPAVARVNVPGEGLVRVVYFLSWDANVYAVRFSDGSELWRFATEDQPDKSFPFAGSPHVQAVGGRETVFIGSGETMYALDAVTGQEIWRFDAGTGCVDPPGLCSLGLERNQIESSAVVADGQVVFGMDVDDRVGGKGGLFSVDAALGTLVWYFDVTTGSTCRPLPGDVVRRYDGYHDESELALPAGFLATRPGCDHDRTANGCGNVWSSPSVDTERQLFFTASSNCDTDGDPLTLEPSPPMPPFDEALFALDYDGNPVWRWRPREVDNDDLAFGAVPNLFQVRIDDVLRDVVGIGNKDGSYTLLDRDGVNAATGVSWDDPDPSGLPYWRTQVVPGGSAGGVIATAAVDEGAARVYFSTAPGSFSSVLNPQRPTMHALDARTGTVLWQNTGEADADASFSPTHAIPGVAFTGSVLGGFLRAYDAATGVRQARIPNGSAVAGPAVALDGIVLVGAGVGRRSEDPSNSSDITSRIPEPLRAYCVPGTRACETAQLLAGRRLLVRDPASQARGRRIVVRVTDPGLSSPLSGAAGDPSIGGAELRVGNPATGETTVISLPGARWTGLGRPAGSRGWRYRDSRREDGPCTAVRLSPNGSLRVSCRGEDIDLSLDEPSQGSLTVQLRLGSDEPYCLVFGGSVQRDQPELFRARDAPAPERCPDL